MAWLLLRNLFFTILQPGLVTAIIPWLLIRDSRGLFVPEQWSAMHFIGILAAVAGLTILMICVWRFPFEGKGTISPLDPTRELVTQGLYKYSRNPMYVGAILLLIGEAIYFESWLLAAYACIVFAVFNTVIILHEEPRLNRVFGIQYDDYRQKVRRWI